MRITLFTENFLPKVDGIVTRVAMTAENLTAGGDQVQIICPDGAPANYKGAAIVGLPAVALPLYPEVRLARPRLSVSRAIDRFRPDVIHVVNPAILGLGGIWMAKRRGIPLVASYHAHLPKYLEHYKLDRLTPLLWQLLKAGHNHAALNLCTSEPIAEELSARGIKRIAIWQQGVDTKLFRPELASRERRRRLLGIHGDGEALLLYVGRLAPEKQIERIRPVLDAMPNARLALVGDGPYRRQLEDIFAGTATTFLGYLSGEELAGAYASADVFLLPSSTETLGLVLLEAMAAGCPVVAANRGGIPYIVHDGVTGALYNPDCPDELVANIRRLLTDADWRQAMQRAARQEAERWSWRCATDELRSSYQRVLSLSQPAR